MKRLIISVLGLVFAAGCWNAALADNSGETIRRFAIFIGANNGGPKRELLQYAVRDAESTANLFRNMGGLKSSDSLLLVDPSVSELNSKMKNLFSRIEKAKEKFSRTEFVFYYSGHSDDEGILLGKEKYTYRELKDNIEKLPADMKVIILDSCASGALTKIKGGSKTQPFLMDSSITMKGYAIMTSSSADEVSQESDSIKGSFFTYSLLSGLRGAADSSGDGKVTLNEAYQYAYQETLVKTERTIGWAQHPNYDIRMKGSGEVVMTDLRETSASLRFAKNLAGRIFIREESELLVAEISKTDGRTIEIGLAPGSYRITVENNKDVSQALVFLNDGDRVELNRSMLKTVKQEYAVKRGDTEDSTSQTNALTDSSNTTAVNPVVTNADTRTDEQALDDLIKRTRSNAQARREQNQADGTNQGAMLENTGVTNAQMSNTMPSTNTNGQFEFTFTVNNSTNYIVVPFNLSIAPFFGTTMMMEFQKHEKKDKADKNEKESGGSKTENKSKIESTVQINASVGYSDRLNGVSAGFVNIVGEDGAYVDSSFVSIVGRDFNGVQNTFFANVGRNYSGVQNSFVCIVGNDFGGVQNGFFNMVGNNFNGVQDGFVNIGKGSFNGLQNGFVNITGGSFTGLQNGFVNVTGKDMTGAVNGFVNISGSNFVGLSTGFVNMTGGKHTGVQLGFVNVADEMVGAPIGFVSIVKKGGQTHLQGWADETGFYHLALLNGAKHFYNIYEIGADLEFTKYRAGVGFGGCVPLWIFSVNLEVISALSIQKNDWRTIYNLNQARLYASVNLFFVTVLAGVSFNYANYQPVFSGGTSDISATFSSPYLDNPITVKPVTGYVFPFSTANHVFWPGFFVGIQF